MQGRMTPDMRAVSECAGALAPSFHALINEAVADGWDRKDIALALLDLARANASQMGPQLLITDISRFIGGERT